MIPLRWTVNKEGETKSTEYVCQSCMNEAKKKGKPILLIEGPVIPASGSRIVTLELTPKLLEIFKEYRQEDEGIYNFITRAVLYFREDKVK